MPYEGTSLDYVVRSQKCDLIFLWSINGQKKDVPITVRPNHIIKKTKVGFNYDSISISYKPKGVNFILTFFFIWRSDTHLQNFQCNILIAPLCLVVNPEIFRKIFPTILTPISIRISYIF